MQRESGVINIINNRAAFESQAEVAPILMPVKKKKLSADEIAEMAMRGEDISDHFTNKGEMRLAIQRVYVDFSIDVPKELALFAKELDIYRQTVIKTYLRQS